MGVGAMDPGQYCIVILDLKIMILNMKFLKRFFKQKRNLVYLVKTCKQMNNVRVIKNKE